MTTEFKMALRSFESQVLFFNGMYKLPIAPFPSLVAEQNWQNKRLNADFDSIQAFRVRMRDFFGIILQNELNEWHDIDEAAKRGTKDDIDLLVELADLLGDIQVYCASEMARFGLPNEEVLKIIMASNFSKLGADGQPIYDASGKVQKGPHYWKPEPQIKELLLSLRNKPIEGEV